MPAKSVKFRNLVQLRPAQCKNAAAARCCDGVCLYYYAQGSDLEVHGGRALIVLLEGVVLAGQDGVEQDADDGGDS